MKKIIENERFIFNIDFDEKLKKFTSVEFVPRKLNDLENKILNEICLLMPQLSLQEIYEHLMIRIENNLRNFSDQKYSGLYFAENKFKEFFFFKKFIRKLIKDISNEKFKNRINFKYITPGNNWMFLNDSERKMKIYLLSEKFLKNHFKEDTGFELLRIEKKTDIFINLPGNLSSDKKNDFCLKFEIFLKKNLDKALVVYFDWVFDKNKLRRLKI